MCDRTSRLRAELKPLRNWAWDVTKVLSFHPEAQTQSALEVCSTQSPSIFCPAGRIFQCWTAAISTLLVILDPISVTEEEPQQRLKMLADDSPTKKININ